MIRIVKPGRAPKLLSTKGIKAATQLCDQFDLNSDGYRNGTLRFEFNAKIYGAATVKKALQKAQHGKCAFCESKVSHVAYGDVEHFRPKAGMKQKPADSLEFIGYYWLAYEWSNLFFSCQICNQRHKGNLFPLEDVNRRAKSHRDSADDESPLFIDPVKLDPSQYIGFREEFAFAINDHPIGRATIEALGLNREEIVERRRDRLQPIKLLKQAVELLAQKNVLSAEDKTHLKRVRSELKRVTLKYAEYSAMVRAALH